MVMDAGKDTMEPIMKVTGKTGNVKDSDSALLPRNHYE
jgi:hypothetical protein